MWSGSSAIRTFVLINILCTAKFLNVIAADDGKWIWVPNKAISVGNSHDDQQNIQEVQLNVAGSLSNNRARNQASKGAGSTESLTERENKRSAQESNDAFLLLDNPTSRNFDNVRVMHHIEQLESSNNHNGHARRPSNRIQNVQILEWNTVDQRPKSDLPPDIELQPSSEEKQRNDIPVSKYSEPLYEDLVHP